MVTFIFKNDKYYKDGTEIEGIDIKMFLNKSQIMKLKETGKIKIKTIVTENKKVSKKSKEEKLLDKIRHNYRANSAIYRKIGFVHELNRKHSKYGYWQFVCYLDNLNNDTIDNAILKDVREQSSLAKNKTPTNTDNDDD